MDVIKIENLAKKFGDKQVHRNISLELHKGECLGLLGGSGEGKSVILRSLIGLEKADAGKIFIESDEISTWGETQLVEIRKKVAYVFQNGALFDSMTVYDNLAYSLREHTDLSEKQIQQRVMDTLEEFGMAGTDKLYPIELSGGMQKRIGLARAIILQPRIVLYDEPTAGLDPYNTRKIQEMILSLKEKGVTSIFVTHDMPSAFAVCDRLALVQNGVITTVSSIDNIEEEANKELIDFIEGKTK